MSDCFGVVYCVTNTITKKRYIGQTIDRNPIKRWKGHIRKARNDNSSFLAKSIRKHGAEAFVFNIVREAFSKGELDYWEDRYIRLLNTMAPRGYNLKFGGARGTLSEVSRQKLKTTLAIPEVKERKRLILIEALNRPEVKLRQSIAQTIAANTPERKALSSKNMKEVHSRPGMKRKHRRAVIIAVNQPGVKERHRAAILEAFARPETKAKRSASQKNLRWITNGVRNRRIRLGELLPKGWRYGVTYTHWRYSDPVGFAEFQRKLAAIGNQAMCAKYAALRDKS